MKKAEDSYALIIRYYEWTGKDGDVRIQVPKGASAASLANLLEQPEGAPLTFEGGDTVVAPAHPYEIVTVEVDYPI